MIRRLVQRITQVREEEIQHIARELHDNIGQRLSLLSIRLSTLSDFPDAFSASDLRELQQEVDALISEVHGVSHSMHSSKLEHLGLEDALAEICRNISHRHHPLEVEFRREGAPGEQNPELSLCFYRIAQEALSNVVKHSCAGRATVLLAETADRLKMQVKDNGIGFDAKAATSGLGLASIKERILAVQGTLSVVSKIHQGVSIIVEAPLPLRRLTDRNGLEM
jgi:signal transduction histidine kinase